MEEAEGAHPGSLRFVACDLAEIDDLPALVTTVRKDVGPIYGLVNNAAVGFDGVLALRPTSQIAELVRVNTLAPIVLTKYVVRAMLADGGGRIVNVASIVGFTGYRGLSVYGATKASLLGFTRSLAREVGGMGVTVNAVAPGFLDTEMTQGLDGAQREQIARRTALRRCPTSTTWRAPSSFCSATRRRASRGPCSRWTPAVRHDAHAGRRLPAEDERPRRRGAGVGARARGARSAGHRRRRLCLCQRPGTPGIRAARRGALRPPPDRPGASMTGLAGSR